MNFGKNELEKEYLKYCKLKKIALNTSELDLSNIDWFYPTSILPLGIFIKENPNLSIIPPIDYSVSNYFNLIIKGRWEGSKKSYIPIVEIPTEEHQREKLLEPLFTNQKKYTGGLNACSYFIGELVDNIYQHSQFSTSYIMAQKYEKKKYTEIGIIDNGISIPGSFEKAGFRMNDLDVLKNVILKGLTTKDDIERGYGLRSSLKLLTHGLNGSCLIISRESGLTADKQKNIFYKMDKNQMFKGTLISVRIPYNYSNVNIYDYVE